MEVQAGLDEVVSAMAMSAAQLGENLSSQLKRNVPVGAMYMPNDLAYNHVNEEASHLLSSTSRFLMKPLTFQFHK